MRIAVTATVVRDPITRIIPGVGSEIRFAVSSTRNGFEVLNPVIATGVAAMTAKLVREGMLVYLEGEIKTRKIPLPDGSFDTAEEIHADRVSLPMTGEK